MTITFDPPFPLIPGDVTIQYFNNPSGSQLTLPPPLNVALDIQENSAIPGGFMALGLRGNDILPAGANYGALFTFVNLQSFISAVGNDFGGDPVLDNERVFLSIFDSSGVLLGSATAQGAFALPNLQPISISSGLNNSKYAAFTFSNDQGYYTVDNIEYRSEVPAVPEPASLVLVGSGLFGILRRRSSRTGVAAPRKPSNP